MGDIFATSKSKSEPEDVKRDVAPTFIPTFDDASIQTNAEPVEATVEADSREELEKDEPAAEKTSEGLVGSFGLDGFEEPAFLRRRKKSRFAPGDA